MTASTALSVKQLERAILADVVTQFLTLKVSTARRDLLIKYRGAGSGTVDAIGNLVSRNWLRRKHSGSDEGIRSPADAQPDRYGILHGSGVDTLAGQWRSMPARPLDMLVLANVEEQLEILRKQRIVVFESQPE